MQEKVKCLRPIENQQLQAVVIRARPQGQEDWLVGASYIINMSKLYIIGFICNIIFIFLYIFWFKLKLRFLLAVL